MIPACLPPLEPTRPKVPPPPNACDTHAHVFGPAARFPYADDRSYTPPDAPLAKYLGMLDAVGFDRGVLVQGSAHGRDNSAMLDALARQPDRLRGVAVADETVSSETLRRWNDLGVRALRFNHFFRDGQLHYRGGVPLDRRADACACDGRAWMASAALDRRQGFARDHSGPEIDRPAGGDRSHGPHRRARRHRGRTVSRACCARSARAGAGQNCRARIASARMRLIIPMRGRFTRRW